MSSKNIPENAKGKPASAGGARKPQSELSAKDLDKVTGGARPTSIGNTKEPLAGG